METLALWLSCRKGWSHKAGKSLVLIQQAHKAYTELDLTHCCWIYRLQSSSFILTAHSPRATPVHLFHPHSSCLFLSAFINKQTVTITATFSQPPLKHAIVRPSQKPPELPQHTRREKMTDVAWLAGWLAGRWSRLLWSQQCDGPSCVGIINRGRLLNRCVPSWKCVCVTRWTAATCAPQMARAFVTHLLYSGWKHHYSSLCSIWGIRAYFKPMCQWKHVDQELKFSALLKWKRRSNVWFDCNYTYAIKYIYLYSVNLL